MGSYGYFFSAFEGFLMTQEMFYDVRRNKKDECKVLFIIFQLCYLDLNLHRKNSGRYTKI